MLYTIIPPVLIVVSLVGIIIFLVKKAPEVAALKEEEIQNAPGSDNSSKKSIWSILRRKNTEEHKDFSHKALLFLEKTTKKLKVFFLKMENMFTDLGESIRNKRNARQEENIIRALEVVEEKKVEVEKTETPEENIEKKEEEKKHEKKEILEKILVERIASNPKDIEAYERLGEYYMEIENWNYAKECYKQVLKLNPRNIGVRSKMRKLERMLSK